MLGVEANYKQILGENESEVMKLLLVHADGNTCTEGTVCSIYMC